MNKIEQVSSNDHQISALGVAVSSQVDVGGMGVVSSGRSPGLMPRGDRGRSPDLMSRGWVTPP